MNTEENKKTAHSIQNGADEPAFEELDHAIGDALNDELINEPDIKTSNSATQRASLKDRFNNFAAQTFASVRNGIEIKIQQRRSSAEARRAEEEKWNDAQLDKHARALLEALNKTRLFPIAYNEENKREIENLAGTIDVKSSLMKRHQTTLTGTNTNHNTATVFERTSHGSKATYTGTAPFNKTLAEKMVRAMLVGQPDNITLTLSSGTDDEKFLIYSAIKEIEKTRGGTIKIRGFEEKLYHEMKGAVKAEANAEAAAVRATDTQSEQKPKGNGSGKLNPSLAQGFRDIVKGKKEEDAPEKAIARAIEAQANGGPAPSP